MQLGRSFRCIVLVFCVRNVFCAPSARRNPSKMPTGEALAFMQRYGYLEEGDGESDALYSEEGISEAIKTLQRFGNIPQTGVIDNSTLELMKSPRCGVPDLVKHKRNKRFVVVRGWNKRQITYYIANWSPTLGEYSVMKNIQMALDTWGKYARLSFHRSQDNNADIIVAFGTGHHGDRFPFDGPGNVLAHAFFPYEDGFGGDIHFDNDETWTDRRSDDPEDGTDFFTVAIHELGHSLGLSHSHHPSSIMFPYYTGFDKSQSSLDYDDILAVYELYIKRRLEDDGHYTSDYFTTSTSVFETTTSPVYSPTPSHTETPQVSTDDVVIATPTYEEDFETVDDHKSHDPTHGIPSTNSPSLPDICNGHFDAVATLRNELFIFKDQYIWRLKEKFRIERNYPVVLQQMFPQLPKSVKRIDAAYQRPDGCIVLFVGMFFWVYDGANFIEYSPRPLTDYGLPGYVDAIDAVQIWGKNGKTYFYKDERFWRYNETTKLMDPGYPKHIERWRGVPENIDAATTWKDGYTYFFKGKLFWKFDNDWVIVTDSSPLPAPQMWLGCPEDFRDTYLLHEGV